LLHASLKKGAPKALRQRVRNASMVEPVGKGDFSHWPAQEVTSASTGQLSAQLSAALPAAAPSVGQAQ